ncbi:TfoX/Sxy family protein [Candidatus Dependentiae bacterium]|nr:TfoX/Sxy family protein [Candidatus Dependentiae bacterium]
MSSLEFVHYAQDLLMPLCRTTMRKVFGCMGLYVNGVMLGFVDSDKLFLKADKDAAVYFKSHGSAPFTYQREGKKVALSYWEVPISLLLPKSVKEKNLIVRI